MLKKNIILVLWFVLTASSVIYLYNQAEIRSDMSFFISENAAEDSKIIQKILTNGESSRIIFIQLYNTNSEQNTEKLAQASKYVRRILSNDSRFITIANGEQDIKSPLDEQLYRYRYLLSSEVNDKQTLFSVESLKNSFGLLAERLQMMVSKQEQIILTEDPLFTWNNYLKVFQNTSINKINGVWFNEQKHAVLIIKTQANGLNLQQQKINIHNIERQLEELAKGISYDISGLSVIALHNSEKIAFQIKIISSIASIILLVFLYSIFRSIKIVLSASLPLFFAVIAGASIVTLVYGYIHGIALAFGITIIGVAVDYPIHYFVHLQTMQTMPSNDISYNKAVIQSIWPKIKLGLLTTLIGFSAITFSSFSGLNQLGLFAISGLISAALMTRYLLPLFHYDNEKSLKIMDFWIRPFQFKNYCHYRLIIFIIIAIAAVHISLTQTLWENDLANLSPVASELKKKDFELRKSLDLPELRYVIIISHRNIQEVLQQSEKISPYLKYLIKQGIISHYDSVTRYIPSIDTQIKRQELIADKLQLEKNLKSALLDSPFNPEIFTPFLLAVQNNKHAVPLEPEQLKDSIIAGKIHSLIFQDKQNGQWSGLILLSGVDSELIHQAFSKVMYEQMELDIEHIKFIDIKQHNQQLMEHYRIESLQWFFIGSLFIVFFLLVYIRKLQALPALIIPFSGAVILSISILILLGYSLSIFHLVTLLLVVGLGIDYSIFIQPDKSDKKDGNEETQKLVESTDINTFTVLVCAISSIIMFFSLSLSSIPVLKAIGLTASLGAGLAFILTLLVSRSCKN